MYKQHFGLKDKPFDLTPDPEYLFLSSKHKMGLALLEYGLMEAAAGLTVITGEVGAGKTTLIRKLLRRIDHNELTIGLINNTNSFHEELMSWVMSSFGLSHEQKDNTTRFREFQKFLVQEYAQGRRCVLIVDEAQNLDSGALEELRMLSNINADRDQLIQIVLVGQPQLLNIMEAPDMAQIAQRVSVEFHLEPLGYEEIKQYISYRLEVAGTKQEIFTDEAMKAVFYLSGGVPRLVNTLCDYALVYSFSMGKKKVDLEIIIEVKRGRRIGGVNRYIVNEEEIECIRQGLLADSGINIADVS